MTNLLEAMISIQYDSSWGIWAESKTKNANWRYGQTRFENGGLLDEFIFIGDGVQIHDHINRYCDHFEGCPEEDELDWAIEGARDFLNQ